LNCIEKPKINCNTFALKCISYFAAFPVPYRGSVALVVCRLSIVLVMADISN